MKKTTFVAIFVPDQCPETGAIKINHISRKLNNTVFFSEQFNLKKDSALKHFINDVRTELFQPHLDKLNNELPDGIQPYILGKPRTLSNLFAIRGQIAIPVEFQLTVDDDVKFTKSSNDFVDALLKCKVISYEELKPRLCTNPKEAYGTWKICPFGKKREFFQWLDKEKKRAYSNQGYYPFKEAFKKAK